MCFNKCGTPCNNVFMLRGVALWVLESEEAESGGHICEANALARSRLLRSLKPLGVVNKGTLYERT